MEHDVVNRVGAGQRNIVEDAIAVEERTMTPNIFIDQGRSGEDFFSHGLAYILNLFPRMGQAFVDRIAVLAGKKPGYFGAFDKCEFVGHTFPQGHTASKPDLKFVCSARTIYFENKLESPLSVAQMQRHAELIGYDSKSHLLFVSNINHVSPDLRSIARYIHPRGKDHYLWVDLLPALASHDRKASLAARIIADFRGALKRYGMVGRTIKGAKGSLYTPGSEASHLALSQLAEELRGLGFTVSRKQGRERTLRVYPSRHGEYPLLNPWFSATAAWLDPKLDFECLIFAVITRTNAPDLILRSKAPDLAHFASRRDGVFVSDPFEHPSGYTCHGHFVLPVTFSSERGTSTIDFPSLANPLKRILRSLTQPPKRKGGNAKRL